MGRSRRVDKPCQGCAKVMSLKPAIAKEQMFCSRSCAYSARVTLRQTLGYCRWCHAESGRVIRNYKDSGVYCSRACYASKKGYLAAEKEALRAIARNWRPVVNPIVEAEAAALRRIARRPVVVRLTHRPCNRGCGTPAPGYMEYSRTCRPCKAESRKLARAKARKTESGRARKRIEKALRRALTRTEIAERIDPKEVFAQDGWKCYLCGIDTPVSHIGTNHPEAPTLDHVVPLARGGHHVWSNVRCACRSCNSLKSDKHYESMGYGGP